MESRNQKETINLLDLLSESESELSDLILTTPKKKKVKRRLRSGVRIKTKRHPCGCTKSKIQIATIWLAAILITLWLIGLSWLAGVLYGEIRRMDISIKSVTVPLRPPTKKMKKRKELDALAPSHVISRRASGKRSSQELLTDSSDERSEYWDVSIRGNRKARGRKNRVCPGLLKACGAFFGCASILATASLIWLFIDVRQQLTLLRTEVDQAIAGSEDVPDALQKCHSLSKVLLKNQTSLFTQLTGVKAEMTNLTNQLSNVQQGLHQVQELLRHAPELTNEPKKLDDVLKSVAKFGSEIVDLQSSVKTLKETDTKLQDVQNILRENITDTKTSFTELLKTNQFPAMQTNETKLKVDEMTQMISELKKNLSKINETLTYNYQWVRQDQKNDHATVVSLQDMTQNASSKVLSLEKSCANASEQAAILTSMIKLTDNVEHARTVGDNLSNRVQLLEQNYNNLKNSTDVLLTSVMKAKDHENEVKRLKKEETSSSNVTTHQQITTTAEMPV